MRWIVDDINNFDLTKLGHGYETIAYSRGDNNGVMLYTVSAFKVLYLKTNNLLLSPTIQRGNVWRLHVPFIQCRLKLTDDVTDYETRLDEFFEVVRRNRPYYPIRYGALLRKTALKYHDPVIDDVLDTLRQPTLGNFRDLTPDYHGGRNIAYYQGKLYGYDVLANITDYNRNTRHKLINFYDKFFS